MYKIGILFQNRDFEHDVYELIKAFYPGNEIVSLYEEDDADYDIRFRVSRDEEGYTISYNNGIEKKTAHGAVIEGQSTKQGFLCRRSAKIWNRLSASPLWCRLF